MNYYNENDPHAAAWLRELINRQLIPNGHVDTRSITEVKPEELHGYNQCHFFAGIGGWARALELAGVSPETPLWTGSCPCQPFSVAGKQRGTADERHLWPAFRDLIAECRPPVIFGEQVASADGRMWFGAVRADLEALGYAAAGADVCAAGAGAPHIRQRIYFVGLADAMFPGRTERRTEPRDRQVAGSSGDGRLADADADADGDGRKVGGPDNDVVGKMGARVGGIDTAHGVGCCAAGGLADGSRQRAGPVEETATWEEWVSAPAGSTEAAGWRPLADGRAGSARWGRNPEYTSPETPDGFWGAADWLYCRDNKWRPVEPGTFPLADGVPARVVRLRGYGNAIVPQVAESFIRAALNLNSP